MRIFTILAAAALSVLLISGVAQAQEPPDPAGDILVTFNNDGAKATTGGLGVPYMRRKQYLIASNVRRDATAVAKEYSLAEIDHWPIKSLSLYCFVFRVPQGADRQLVIAALNDDDRVESAQALHSFETQLGGGGGYDDTYANLQYGLDVLEIAAAHRTTRGAGVRVAIIDSHADRSHEDLKGRIRSVQDFSNKNESADDIHGTAIASVIGARSNNARGIVGIAPEATLELYVSCWSNGVDKPAVCDSFSLSKALDAMLENPPQVLNLSLTGPYDPLLERLIQKAVDAGVVVVAAGSTGNPAQRGFPSSMHNVIGVGATPAEGSPVGDSTLELFAPGNRILVAVPTNRYDFRSGSSLAAAHVSGVVALILAVAPGHSQDTISRILQRSQVRNSSSVVSINACTALNLAANAQHCGD